jgi:hypothetical protein
MDVSRNISGITLITREQLYIKSIFVSSSTPGVPRSWDPVFILCLSTLSNVIHDILLLFLIFVILELSNPRISNTVCISWK